MSGEPLDAGRGTDALVAETIFGAVINRCERGPWRLLAKDGTPEHIGDATDTPWYYGTVPDFSTSIAAAWLVVEAMANLAPDPWMLKLSNWRHYDERWFVALFTPSTLHGIPIERTGATAPLAICRAALAARSLAQEKL